MLGAIDFRDIQEESADLALLDAYLQQIVGQPLLFIRFSYGDELTLHLGEPRAYRSSKMVASKRGEYVLGTRASPWHLRSPGGSAIAGTEDAMSAYTPISKKDVEDSNVIEVGALVVRSTVVHDLHGIGLSLAFSDGSSLVLSPSAKDANHELADWELFTPFERIVRVGPGEKWSCLRSTGTSAQ